MWHFSQSHPSLFLKDLAGQFDIGSFESYDHRHRYITQLRQCCYDTTGDPVCPCDAAKNIDQNGLDLWVGYENLERVLNRFLAC